MRYALLFLLTVACVACGTDATGTDATADAASDVATDATGVDGAGDATATDASPTDATSTDTGASASPWKSVVFINEVNAGGNKVNPVVADDTDWIELYNASAAEVDLTSGKLGGLANGAPGASPLPKGTKIAANGFLVVYFNHLNMGSPVIDAGIKSNGSMVLWDGNSLVADSVDWNEGASPAGSTYDRTPDGSATWKTVTPPTPGKANSK